MTYTNKIFEFAKQFSPALYWMSIIENSNSATLAITPANKANDCYSVSKLFTVTALGMLYDEGKLDVNEKIVDIFSTQLPPDLHPNWKSVTVDMVMRHRWGIEKGFLDIDCEDVNAYAALYGQRNNYLKIIFSVPLSSMPNQEKVYSDAAYYLLSRVVAKKSEMDLYDYLRIKLFNPLEFEEAAWAKCPMGYSMGATGLYLRSSDMVKLGQVYLQDGQFNHQQIISSAWRDLVFEREYELSKCNASGYCKNGMHGQCLYVDPAHHFTAGWLGFDSVGYQNQLHRFLMELNA
ncbi:MAG: serine hydrolase domain-containing protein [Candidatus Merdivicinus sp.]